MEFITISDRSVFDSFVTNHPNTHYMKTSMWGELKKRTENYRYTMHGFYEDGRLVGTAMVLHHSWFTHPFLYVPKGICLDYENEERVKEAYLLLSEYADSMHVQFLRVDPNVLRREHELDGTVIENGINHEHITDALIRLGYTHKGYGYAYNGSWTNRFTLIVDLKDEMDIVRSRFSKRRKRSVKKNESIGITTRTAGKEELGILMDMQKMLTEQHGFKPDSREYFETLMDCFGKHAVYYVSTVQMEQMIAYLRTRTQIRDNPAAAEKAERELGEALRLQKQYGNQIPVASGLFIRINHMCWCWYYYFNKFFRSYSPLDSLHCYAMQDCRQYGVTKYDLSGFSGTVDKNDPVYRLYEYKHEFGPQFIEEIGEFDYVRHTASWKRFKKEKIVVNHFKRKYWEKRYKKEGTDR